MSALRKQLATLHSTRLNELDLRAQQSAHAKSLLFDPVTAGSQSFDEIFSICQDGFEELCALDARFLKYERSLFSTQSKSQERRNMTEAENQDLDQILESFLSLVGARLLLKPAQKAVEWLIRRFQIYEYNTNQLVLTFLPYHATPLFLAILSILPSSLSPSIKFLHRYATSSQNPPRDVLVHEIIHNLSFFNSFNDFVLRVSKSGNQYSSLISLWAVVMVQGVDGILRTSFSGRPEKQRQREDDLLTKVLPILDRALVLQNAPEISLGCYMIISVIIRKANVSEKCLTALVCAVAGSWSVDIATECISCLALIAEQRRATMLPTVATQAILRTQNPASILEFLSVNQPVESLTLGLAEALLSPSALDYSKSSFSVMADLIQKNLIAQSHDQALLRHLQSQQWRSTTIDTESDRRMLEKLLAARDPFKSSTELPVSGKNSLDPNDFQELYDEPSTLHNECLLELETGEFMLPTDESILKSTDHRFLRRIMNFYEANAQDKDRLRQLLKLDAPSEPSTKLVAFFVLFYVLSCSDSSAARQTALDIISAQISNIPAIAAFYPTFTIFGLLGMSDKTAKVRTAAAGFLTSLAKKLELDPDTNLVTSEIADSQIKKFALPENSVSRRDMLAFLKLIIEHGLEECVNDADMVMTRLIRAIGTLKTAEGPGRHAGFVRLKSSQRSAIFSAFCGQIRLIEVRRIRSRFLQLLNGVGKIAGQPRSKYLLPVLKQYCEGLPDERLMLHREGVEVASYEQALLKICHPGDSEAITLLASIARGRYASPSTDMQSAALQRLQLLWPSISFNDQKILSLSLLPQSENSLGTNGSNEAESSQDQAQGDIAGSLPLSADILISLAEYALHQMRSAHPYPEKRRRTQGDSHVSERHDLGDHHQLRQLTSVVELIDSSASKANIHLFHALFEILGECRKLSIRLGSELGYLINITLQALWSIMHSLQRDGIALKIDKSVVRLDLLVDSVRITPDSQARNAALLLLANLSEHIPHEVLHAVMPIFTMISSTTAKQTDDLSAFVVDQTILKVVPILAHALKKEKQDLASSTAEILINFAAAFEHIPSHRRGQLFSLLTTSLGPGESLFAVIATLVDHFPTSRNVKDFCSFLFANFDSAICLETVHGYILMIKDGQQAVPELFQTLSKQEYTASARSEMILEHLLTVRMLLDNRIFRERMRQDTRASALAGQLCDLLTESLILILNMAQHADSLTRTSMSQTLEALLVLVPIDVFTKSIDRILEHYDQDLIKAALKIMEKRIRALKMVGGRTRNALMNLVRRLYPLLAEESRSVIKPNILSCIDGVCERFGKMNPVVVSEAMQVVASDHCLLADDYLLRALSLHCLASSIEAIGSESTPLLQRAQDAALLSLREALNVTKRDELLHNASLAFLIALLDHMPFIMSRSALATAVELLGLSTQVDLGREAAASRIRFTQVAAVQLDAALLTQVLIGTWGNTVAQGPNATLTYVSLAKTMITAHTKAVVVRNARAFFDMYLQMLDLRSLVRQNSVYPLKKIDELETSVNDIVVAFVLKINDTTFKPLFSQLMAWSSATKRRGTEDWQNRATTFFNLTVALSTRLKSIFTSYFGGIVDIATTILLDSTLNNRSTRELRGSVMRSVTSSFEHDKSGFWQAPSRFEAMSKGLVGQLLVAQVEEATTIVVPAITGLATAAASPENHRSLNSLLLQLFRSEKSRVRLFSIKTQQALTEKLRDDWLSNLPEMLPLISELQEDDDEVVERETHKWIDIIEETLGESLSSMLQ